jgi:hypothetical protein
MRTLIIHQEQILLNKFTQFMTSIDFILNRPNRKADTKWKTEMASRSKLVLSFFRKVLSWGAPALEESQVEAQNVFFETVTHTLE